MRLDFSGELRFQTALRGRGDGPEQLVMSGNYINGTPVAAAGWAVFGGCDAVLHVVNLATGQPVKQVDGGVASPPRRRWSAHAFFGQYQNELLCVDLERGVKVWTYKDQ